MSNEFKVKRAGELVKKLQDVIVEVKKEIDVRVCESDDGDVVSIPVGIEYDEQDDCIYINAEYGATGKSLK